MSSDGRWIGEPRRGIEEEEATLWRGDLGTEDILGLFEGGISGYWILGRMVKVVDKEQ